MPSVFIAQIVSSFLKRQLPLNCYVKMIVIYLMKLNVSVLNLANGPCNSIYLKYTSVAQWGLISFFVFYVYYFKFNRKWYIALRKPSDFQFISLSNYYLTKILLTAIHKKITNVENGKNNMLVHPHFFRSTIITWITRHSSKDSMAASVWV